MLPHNFRWISVGLICSDLGLIGLATWIAVKVRAMPSFLAEADDIALMVLPLAVVAFVLWPTLIFAMGGFSAIHTGSGADEYKRVLHASFYTAALLGLTAYLLRYPLSRAFYLLLFGIGTVLLLLGRFLVRKGLHRARAQGKMLDPVLLVGDLAHVNDLRAVLQREPWLGYRPVGLLLRDPPVGLEFDPPVLGGPRDCLAAVVASGASTVIFAEGSFKRAHEFNRIAAELEDLDVHTVVVPALAEISTARMSIRPVAGLPLVHVDRPQAQKAGHWLKRLVDIAGSVTLLLLSSPLLLVAAIAIKRADGGPIFFRQARVGIHGEEFDCLKLRTMVVDAEKLRDRLEAQNQSEGPLFKMDVDPRITKPGRWLRRYSIDEIPQFWNVLVGDMSLVGPRPALPKEVDEYKAHVRRRLAVRPGITGLWQVSGRSDLSWDETVRLDLYYVDNWSPVQDFQILARTVGVVLKGTGAY